MLLSLAGFGIIIVILGGVIVEVSMYYSRKCSRADTTNNKHATSKETSVNEELILYRFGQNNAQEQNNSNYCKIILPCNKSDMYSSPQYEEHFVHDTGRCSNLGTVNEVTMAADSTTTYAEPFQYTRTRTVKASEIYAVPYHEPTHNKEDSEISYENMLLSESINDILPPEVSVRNSLYSSS
jgi:hypothetical protein